MSKHEFVFFGKKYISLKRASEISGYTKDYIGQLCRGGKIKNERVGHNWFVEYENFISYSQEKIEKQKTQKQSSFKSDLISDNQHEILWNENLLNSFKRENIFNPYNFKIFACSLIIVFAVFGILKYPNQIEAVYTKLVKPVIEEMGVVTKESFNFLSGNFLSSIVSVADEISSIDFEINMPNVPKIEIPEIEIRVGLDRFNELTTFAQKIGSGYLMAINAIANSVSGFSFSASEATVSLVKNISKENISKIKLPKIKLPEIPDIVFNFPDLPKFSKPEINFNLASVGSDFTQGADMFFGYIKNGWRTISKGIQGITDDLVATVSNIKLGPNIEDVWNREKNQKNTEQSSQNKNTILESRLSSVEQELIKIKNSGFSVSGPTIQKTVVQKTVENILSGLSDEDVNKKISEINSSLLSQINDLKNQMLAATQANFNAIALTQRINNLSSVTISSPIISGTVSGLTDASIPDDITASNYLLLTGGTLTSALTGTSATFSGQISGSYFDFSTSGATSTIAGNLTITKSPSTAHSFAVWDTNAANSAVLNSSLLINPSLVTADTNMIGIAVGGNVKFLVDSEGDVFVNSLTATGTVTQALTNISTLIVENNTTLGDAISDLMTFKSGDIIYFNKATSTIVNNTVNAWSLATSTSIVPTLTVSTASSPFGYVGIGTTSPYTTLSVNGETVASYFTAASTTATSTFPYLSVTTNSNLGTIIGGTWQGSPIGISYGGTGLSSISAGQTLYASAANTLSATSTLYLASSGNFGIGTTSPSAKMHLEGGNFYQTMPSTLSDIGFVNISDANTIYILGRYAYITSLGTTNGSLYVVDLGYGTIASSSPTIIGSVHPEDSAHMHGLAVAGNYAYAIGPTGGAMYTFDISDPRSPFLANKYSNSAFNYGYEIYISGKYAYTVAPDAGTFAVVDIINPLNPYVAGSYASTTLLNGVNSVFVSGKYAYAGTMYDVNSALANRQTNFHIFNVSDPTSPMVVSSTSSPLQFTGNNDVDAMMGDGCDVVGKYAYWTYFGGKLLIMDVSSSTAPSLVSSYTNTLLKGANAVHVAGRYAYIALEKGAGYTNQVYDMAVVDISDPSNPFLASLYDDGDGVSHGHDLFISGKYVYLLLSGGGDSSREGMRIIDISGIDAPGANIGDLTATTIEVGENLNVGNNLYVKSGLNVGSGGGIATDGSLSVKGTGYFLNTISLGASTTNAFDLRYNVVASSTFDIYDQISNTSRLSINSSGFLGLGTSSPIAKLEVVSNGTNPMAVFDATGSTHPGRTLTIKDKSQVVIRGPSYPGSWAPALNIQNDDNSSQLWMSPLPSDSSSNARIRTAPTGLDFYVGGTVGTASAPAGTGSLSLTLNSTGAVGIGSGFSTTIIPNSLLEIRDASVAPKITLTAYTDTPTLDPAIIFRTGATPATKFIMGVDYSDSNKFKISPATFGTSDRLTIDSSGRIGIGINNPISQMLHLGKVSAVTGSATATTTITLASSYLHLGGTEYKINSYRMITFGTISDASAFAFNVPAYFGYQETSVSNYAKGDLIFGTRSVVTDTAPTERMRITSAGNVGIGTSTPNWDLQIASTTDAVLALSNTSATLNNKHWLLSSIGGNFQIGTSTDTFTATSTYLTINNNGFVGIGSTSPNYLLSMESTKTGGFYDQSLHQWTTGSQRSIKQDISLLSEQDKEDVLTILEGLSMNKYRFITDVEQNGDNAIWQYGIIADEGPELLTGHGHSAVYSGSAIQFLLTTVQILNQKIKDISGMIVDGVISAKEFIADKITTKELCVGDTCVNEEQLKKLLETSGQSEVLQPVPEPVLEPTPEPVPEPTSEPVVSEPTPEPISEPFPEPTPETN